MLNVTVLVGNPKPQSRTLQIAQTLVDTLLLPGSFETTVIDLAEHTGQVFDWPSDFMAGLNQQVADSDLLVVASPTYKATYTGLLKAFLDRYPAGGLSGVTAVPVMTGADLSHSMGPEVNMRPLLVELGASVPTKGLYFVTSHMDRLEDEIAAWVEENARTLRSLTPLIEALAPAGVPRPADLEGAVR